MRSWEEIKPGIEKWLDEKEEAWDEEVGLLACPTNYMSERGLPVGPPATGKGYHCLFQDGTYYGVNLLLVGRDLERGRRVLTNVLSHQYTDPNHRYYGNYPVHIEDPDCYDGNCAFFNSTGLLTAFFKVPENLGDDLLDKVRQAMKHSLGAFARPTAGTAYTNPFLGGVACGLLMAEIAGDDEALAVVRDNCRLWYRTNFQRGVPERLSDGYYVVDVHALGLALSYGRDPVIRQIAREAMGGFLTEMNFYGDRHYLPSRRSSALTSGDAVTNDAFHWIVGVIDLPEVPVNGRLGLWHGALSECGVDVGPLDLPTPRVLTGGVGGGRVYSYYHSDFTMGCFSRYPFPSVWPSTVDLIAGFGDSRTDAGHVAFYAVTEDGACYRVPGERTFAARATLSNLGSPGTRAVPGFVCNQHENLLVALLDFDNVCADLVELGIQAVIPTPVGRVVRCGDAASGDAGEANSWVMLECENSWFGLRGLKRLDWDYQVWHINAPCEGPVYWTRDEDALTVRWPNFRGDTPRTVARSNVSAGLLVVGGSRRQYPSAEAFADYLSGIEVTDEWEIDTYVVRGGLAEGIRTVTVDDGTRSLLIRYDYQLNELLEQKANGIEVWPETGQPKIHW